MAKAAFLETVVKKRCGDGVDPRQILIDLYVDHSLSSLALMFDCDPSTISKNLKESRLMGYKPANGNGAK